METCCLACPYISETNLSQLGDCPILILACDGVWDVFTDQEAADLLMERYLVEGPFANAAELLVLYFFPFLFLFVIDLIRVLLITQVNAAIEKGSADNVTAIVIFL